MRLFPLTRMLRALAPSLLAVTLLPTMAVAAGKPASVAPVAPASPPVPLLWKVSDADNAIYLLGSFHVLKADDYPLSKDIDAAFDDAEALAFEIAPEEMTSPQLGMAMAKAALRTDGKRLGDTLPPDTAKQFDAWVAANGDALMKSGIPGPALQMFEPWFAGMIVSLTEMGKFGLDPANGLDMRMIQRAAGASKPATGLELGSDQIALFDGMDPDLQVQFLKESLGDAEGARKEIETLHADWRRGDAQALWNGMAADMREKFPGLYQRINVARNDAWVPKLQRMLDDAHDKDTLVVVGSLHLLGSDGVVEKLRAKGYKVERICSACTETSTK